MKGKNKKVESKLKTDSLSICPCEKTLKGRPSWIASGLFLSAGPLARASKFSARAS